MSGKGLVFGSKPPNPAPTRCQSRVSSCRAAMLLAPMELSRIAWLTTVGICVVAAALLLISDYYGYAGVLAAVGLSAAINLR